MLELRAITRAYNLGGERAGAFDVSLTVPAGTVAVLAGPSGSGKTTLLQVAGLLDFPDTGEVLIGGEATSRLTESQRCEVRLRRIGFVFQAYNLLPELDALENVMLPLQLQDRNAQEARSKAQAMLARMGLADRMHHTPARLSGGQQQRVAIARALVHDPSVLIADEPTASLDHAHGLPMLDLLASLAKERGVACLLASHDPLVIARAERIFRLEDGRLMSTEERL